MHGVDYTGVHAQFIKPSLETASTFLDVAEDAYSANNKGRGDRAIGKASRSLSVGARFMEHLSSISPVTAAVLQDKHMVHCQKRIASPDAFLLTSSGSRLLSLDVVRKFSTAVKR